MKYTVDMLTDQKSCQNKTALVAIVGATTALFRLKRAHSITTGACENTNALTRKMRVWWVNLSTPSQCYKRNSLTSISSATNATCKRFQRLVRLTGASKSLKKWATLLRSVLCTVIQESKWSLTAPMRHYLWLMIRVHLILHCKRQIVSRRAKVGLKVQIKVCSCQRVIALKKSLFLSQHWQGELPHLSFFLR